MGWRPLRLAPVALTCLAALGQTNQPPLRVEPGTDLTVDMFCSETKLRTSNARVRWSIPAETLRSNGVTSLAASGGTLDVTVYKDGFEKGLMVSLPISPASPARPVMPLAVTNTQVRPQLRAFQIRLIEIEQPNTLQAANAPAIPAGVVVENLEPGVNYTFRLALGPAGVRMASAAATGQALVCPADMVPTTAVPRRRKK